MIILIPLIKTQPTKICSKYSLHRNSIHQTFHSYSSCFIYFEYKLLNFYSLSLNCNSLCCCMIVVCNMRNMCLPVFLFLPFSSFSLFYYLFTIFLVIFPALISYEACISWKNTFTYLLSFDAVYLVYIVELMCLLFSYIRDHMVFGCLTINILYFYIGLLSFICCILWM